MINNSQPVSDAASVSLEVELGGRRFPLTWDQSRLPPRRHIRKLQERAEDNPLAHQLSESIWTRLAWTALPSNDGDRQSCVEAYVRSLNQLDQFRLDVESMIRAACLASLEFRQALGETHANSRDAALNQKLDEMLDQAACDWRSPRNVLDARTVSLPVETLREKLSVPLRSAVDDFSIQFFEMLAKLVDRELVGLVEWLPNQCCSYHFFRRIVIQENHGGGVRRVEESRFDRIAERDPVTGRQIVGKRTVTTVAGSGVHYHRFARHEHEVMNAVATTIKDSRVVMPPQVERLIGKIPDWLYPFVKVIDGDIFRERIIEREQKVSSWEDVQIRDEPIIGCEPGVIIGPYVLIGWGPREVATELQRRQDVQRGTELENIIRVARSRTVVFTAAAAVLSVSAMLFLDMSMRGMATGFLTFATTTAAIGSTWIAAFDHGVSQRLPTARLSAHFFAGTLGCRLLLAEWLLARWYQPLSWVTPVVLAGGALLCHVIARRLQVSPANSADSFNAKRKSSS